MTDPIVVVEELRFAYGGRAGVAALDGVSLEIAPRSVLGVVGQNGSGKTTLTKHLNGLLRPTSGRVVVDGRDTRRHSVQMLARHVGYVFQNPGHQLFARTVADELAFGPRNLGCQRDEIERRVSSVAERLGLTDVLDRHPLRLPYPLRKLACIGSVLTMEPRVLVLDEPTAGQDHRTARRIADLVVELRQGGTTVVCASHDLRLVGQLADRVVVLRDGRLVGDGPPRALLSDRELLRATGLVPPQITELSLAMAGRGDRPAALSVGELVDEVRGT